MRDIRERVAYWLAERGRLDAALKVAPWLSGPSTYDGPLPSPWFLPDWKVDGDGDGAS